MTTLTRSAGVFADRRGKRDFQFIRINVGTYQVSVVTPAYGICLEHNGDFDEYKESYQTMDAYSFHLE